MGKRIGILILCALMSILCAACSNKSERVSDTTDIEIDSSELPENDESETITEGNDLDIKYGTSEYRGFTVDNVLHSEVLGDIHFNLHIPDSYDGSEAYAIYFTLPGYQGLYFQGVAQNIKTEEFGFEAQKYNDKMIIVAPQLEDWGETSANKTIELVEYFISHYKIDTNKVYGSGYSGGGETMSLVIGKRPDLFTAYLHCSSRWDGDYDVLVDSQTPVYLAIGESDEYYGSEPTKEAYEAIYNRYVENGLSEQEISELIVLDVKEASYFTSQNISNQHGGGAALLSADESIMGWLFGK